MKKQNLRSVGMAVAASLLALSSSAHAGFYSPVQCSSESFFQSNSCDLCYEEKTPIVPGMQLIGLYDTWINPNTTPQHIYEDEQTARPIMINFGGSGTIWNYSEVKPFDMWEFTSDVAWTTTGSTNRKFAIIPPQWQSMKFVQQKSWTTITLQKTDVQKGSYIGMMKFPLTYRDVSSTGAEGNPITHYECVTYRSGEVPKTVIATTTTTPPPKQETVAPVKKEVPPPPTPKQITKTQTGPEIWIAGLLALLIAGMLVFQRQRRG